MQTSYFAKYKGNRGINIAMKPPDDFYGLSYFPLFPQWSFLSQYFNNKDEKAYRYHYHRLILSKLNANKVYEDLKDNVLLCYEKSGEFCHRRLVANWIFETIGVVVNEL